MIRVKNGGACALVCLLLTGLPARGTAGQTTVSTPSGTAPLFRIFLKDGSALVSYGELARIGDRVVIFSELENIISDIKLQRNKLPPDLKDEGKLTEKRAIDLRTKVHKLINDSSTGARPRTSGSSAGSSQAKTDDQKSTEDRRVPRIAAAVEEAGVEVSAEVKKVLDIIEEVLVAVLHQGTRDFTAVLEGIESAVAEEFGEED